MKQDDERAEFWSTVEKELGEKVEAYSLARCYFSEGKQPTPTWGICYVTKSAFYFRHFAQENWFAAVLKVAGRGAKKDEEFTIRIPLASIVSVSPPPRQGFLARLLGTETPPFVIEYATDSEPKAEMRISIDLNLSEIMSVLNGRGTGTAGART
jgi:hypothetical protein